MRSHEAAASGAQSQSDELDWGDGQDDLSDGSGHASKHSDLSGQACNVSTSLKDTLAHMTLSTRARTFLCVRVIHQFVYYAAVNAQAMPRKARMRATARVKYTKMLLVCLLAILMTLSMHVMRVSHLSVPLVVVAKHVRSGNVYWADRREVLRPRLRWSRGFRIGNIY